ncbi:MAG TPA: hypothetical protein VK540_05505 [Polyangiaceae bacterium]|jgi:hypothetical protein|nr:hypothetical protein [Polyangiaceae bacterium]
MGAGTVELTGTGKVESTGEEEPQELEREVEDIRENITGIVGELDRRRHDLFDWRLQLRKHGPVLAAVTAGWVLAFGVTIAVGAARRRRRNRPLAKMRRLRQALSRMIEHPELVAQPQPSIARKVLAAAASATVASLAKTLVKELGTSLESSEASIRVIKS